MDRNKIKCQLIEFRDRIISRLKKLRRELLSWRFGHQLGLVIAENSVRVCLLKCRLYRKRVIAAATYALDPDNSSDWNAKVEAAATIIIGYLNDNNLSRSRTLVNIGLVGEDIAFRRLYLPEMPSREFSSAIKWEGEKLFPFEFDQCNVDFQKVDRGSRNGVNYIGVNITAAKKTIIDSIYDRFPRAGLKVGQVGFIASFLASITSSKAFLENKNDHTLLLYLGDEYSLALFLHNGSPEFFQQFVTRPITHQESDLSLANLDALAAELTSFLDLYNGQSSGNTISKVYLTGKYAGGEGIASYFGENIGLPCHSIITDPALTSQLGYPDQSQLEEYLDVILTAIAPAYENPLAPKTVRKAEERARFWLRIGYAAFLGIVISGTMHIHSLHHEEYCQNELESKISAVKSFEKSSGYRGYINLIGKLDRGREYINRTENKPASHYHVLLKELSLNLPDHINLTSIDLEKEKGQYILRLAGNVRLTGFSPEIILADYVEILGDSPFFQNVSVLNYDKRREQDRFDLAFQLKMDARV